MDQLRVLQVGLGGWGRDWAHRIIPAIPEVQVVGYVDPDPSALARLRDEVPVTPAQCFLTLERPIEDTQPGGPAAAGRHVRPSLRPPSPDPDREPEGIFCEAWNPEWTGFSGPSVAVASIQFEGGIIVSYRGSWVSTGPVTPWSGEWRMDFEHGQIFWTSRDDDGARHDRVAIHRPARRPSVVPLPALPQTDRWGTLTEFARAIHQGREPECSGRDNLGT